MSDAHKNEIPCYLLTFLSFQTIYRLFLLQDTKEDILKNFSTVVYYESQQIWTMFTMSYPSKQLYTAIREIVRDWQDFCVFVC